MCTLNDKSLKYFYMLKSNIVQTWKYFIVLNIKEKPNFKHFYYIHTVEIPTQKGEHSWKYTELSLKRKEGISSTCTAYSLKRKEGISSTCSSFPYYARPQDLQSGLYILTKLHKT